MTGLDGQSISGVLFDLDGTLVNTLSDLGDAMNQSLLSQGLPCHETAEYANMIGGEWYALSNSLRAARGTRNDCCRGCFSSTAGKWWEISSVRGDP